MTYKYGCVPPRRHRCRWPERLPRQSESRRRKHSGRSRADRRCAPPLAGPRSPPARRHRRYAQSATADSNSQGSKAHRSGSRWTRRPAQHGPRGRPPRYGPRGRPGHGGWPVQSRQAKRGASGDPTGFGPYGVRSYNRANARPNRAPPRRAGRRAGRLPGTGRPGGNPPRLLLRGPRRAPDRGRHGLPPRLGGSWPLGPLARGRGLQRHGSSWGSGGGCA